MLNIRKTVLTGLAVVAIGAGWLAKTIAQENLSSPVVTYFDHEKVDASFARADSADGFAVLWGHTSSQGTYEVHTNSRIQVDKPEVYFHHGYMGVVYVVSGSATLVIGGPAVAAKTTVPDKFGGQSIQGGELRISKGDVIIVPPDCHHWYKDVKAPFHYLMVEVP